MFIKVGWMYKYGSFFPCAWWGLYWFVLDQVTCSLSYYKSPKNPKRKGTFILDGTHLILTYDKLGWVYLPPWLKREHMFGLLVGSKTINLCCYYVGETESWIEVIDMFRPEFFDKRLDAADRIIKCMKFNWAYKDKRREQELAKKMEEERNVLEAYLPIHSKIYGLGEPTHAHQVPPQYIYPYDHVPRHTTLNPHLMSHLKSAGSRALTLLAHSPPHGMPYTPSRRSSGIFTYPDWRKDSNSSRNELSRLLGTLTDTKEAINTLVSKQKEQAARIQTLQDMMKDKTSDSERGSNR